MPKVLKSICRKLWRLSACQKSTSSLASFWRYRKDIENLLFWELWECLIIPIKIMVSIYSKLSSLNQLHHFFYKIVQTNSKPVILGNLAMPGTYLQAKNQVHPSRFRWYIAKILQTCYFEYFEHARLRTPKVILSSCRKLLRLSAAKK